MKQNNNKYSGYDGSHGIIPLRIDQDGVSEKTSLNRFLVHEQRKTIRSMKQKQSNKGDNMKMTQEQKERYKAWTDKYKSDIALVPCEYPTLQSKLDAVVTCGIMWGGFGLIMWVLSNIG